MKNIFLTAVQVADRVDINLCGTKFYVNVDRETCGRVFIRIHHYYRNDAEIRVVKVEGRKYHLDGTESRSDILRIINEAFKAAVAEILPKALLIDGQPFFDQSHLILPIVDDREAIDEELFKPELCEV